MTENKFESTSLADAQTEMRRAFLGGFAGQLVSGIIWLPAGILLLLKNHKKRVDSSFYLR